MRMNEIIAERMRAHRGCEALSVDSRQQRRARIRKETFADITKRFGPEPRKARRGIALALARKRTENATK